VIKNNQHVIVPQPNSSKSKKMAIKEIYGNASKTLLDAQKHVSSVPVKLKWLKGIVHKLGTKKVIDPRACMGMMLYIEKLQEMDSVPKEDLTKCNDILKCLQKEHKFKIDWRGDLVWDLLPEEWFDD